MNEKLEALRIKLITQTLERMNAQGLTHAAQNYTARIKEGKKYTKLDIGPACNMSGRYMIENETGNIYGIKAYGVIHRGHYYGTLDTIDQYDWSGYTAYKINTGA